MSIASIVKNAPKAAEKASAIRLIALDIDGTLLDSNATLSDENRLAICDAAAAGIEIVIVTGRRFHSARLTVEPLTCEFDVIATNGAIVKSKSGETLRRHLLPAALARHILDHTVEFRHCAGVIFDRPRERQVIFEKIDWNGPYVGPYLSRHRDQVAEVVPLVDCLEEDPLEVMFLGGCEEIERARKQLEALPFSGEFMLSWTVYDHRNIGMLDVLRRGVNKGAALADWCQHRGIPREAVMAIGDNWNDREMLEFAGLPVVMGNCVPELKTLGWTATLSNDAHGVAHAIRRFALNGKPR